MTKAELISEIAKLTGINKKDVALVISNFMMLIRQRMREGDAVFLRGFGSFTLVKRAEKIARNISKNEPIRVPAHYVPVFKPSKKWVEEIKSNTEDLDKKLQKDK